METNPSDLMLEKARAEKMARARQETPTPLEIVERLGQILDVLEGRLSSLSERLAPVLVDAEPTKALAAEPSPGRTLLSQRLTHLAAWAERLDGEIAELHARVEL